MTTIQDFNRRFPTDEACLDHLMVTRYGAALDCPKCGKRGKFHRIRKIPAYECQWCGHHIHPMAGTPFERTHTSLTKWFYAMYLFCSTRHGVSAKELQRQLGVTYKTAWRMGHEIRKYMAEVDGDNSLDGHVEIDEAYSGGRIKGQKKLGVTGRGAKKTIVMGMVERDGEVITRVVPHASRAEMFPHIKAHVEEGTTISTDEWPTYKTLPTLGYKHGVVEHGAKVWVHGTHHTNTIEAFWGILKRSIRSTHIGVSKKHLQKYLGEFEYRFNMRKAPTWALFQRLLGAF